VMQRVIEQMKEMPSGLAGPVEADHELVDGVVLETDLGPWTTYETPGHSPAHVCLFQPERRILISGDHVLGRISLFFEYGHTPDPIGEFLHSLDVVDVLDARLCLSGHGRTFTDVHAHIEGNRELVAQRLDAAVAGVVAGESPTALELAPAIFGEPLAAGQRWRLMEVVCYLRHLEATGRLVHETKDGVERWRATG
jgi:glyoxylase-like metal-dependent hydrolase (beta-lactamase superfamily II)